MFAAFQSNAFQANAFQIGSGGSPSAVPTRPDKEGYSYHPQRQIKLYRKRVEEIDENLAIATERERIAAMRAIEAEENSRQEKAIKKLLAAQVKLEKEISELRTERARLMRMIDDEEAVLVLLLSWPLH